MLGKGQTVIANPIPWPDSVQRGRGGRGPACIIRDPAEQIVGFGQHSTMMAQDQEGVAAQAQPQILTGAASIRPGADG
jgi:hypothetical protein